MVTALTPERLFAVAATAPQHIKVGPMVSQNVLYSSTVCGTWLLQYCQTTRWQGPFNTIQEQKGGQQWDTSEEYSARSQTLQGVSLGLLSRQTRTAILSTHAGALTRCSRHSSLFAKGCVDTPANVLKAGERPPHLARWPTLPESEGGYTLASTNPACKTSRVRKQKIKSDDAATSRNPL